MTTDPAVARRKFQREVDAARAHTLFQRQGVWILRAEYPLVFVVFVINKPFPLLPGVLCAAHIDFTDYDARPPSVRFVDPFSEQPLPANACWVFPIRRTIVDPESGQTSYEVQTLLQNFNPDKPFLCMPGVREYHECSAHSGDSWFQHRKPNMLVHLLTVLHRHGPSSVGVVTETRYQIAATKVEE
jgi:hypothetical protein